MPNQATNFLSQEAMDHMARRRKRTENRDAERDVVMRLIYSKPGLAAMVAKQVGVSHQSVGQWNRVPAHYVLDISPLVGLTPEQIRPDVFARRRK